MILNVLLRETSIATLKLAGNCLTVKKLIKFD